jgi:mono/diheme cytochrome c family protein
MKRALLLALALGGCTQQPDFAFRNASITLPEATATLPPGGPNVDLVTANCTACHSAEMINNQPALSQAAWDATITKMQKVYKAPIDDADRANIIAYLMRRKVAETAPRRPPEPSECAASPCRE